MYHCHNLVHEDNDMLLVMQVGELHRPCVRFPLNMRFLNS